MKRDRRKKRRGGESVEVVVVDGRTLFFECQLRTSANERIFSTEGRGRRKESVKGVRGGREGRKR